MNWIRIATEISRDAQIKQLARTLNIKRAEAIGCVTSLLTHLPAHAPSGNLSQVADADLEEFAVWERKRGVFACEFRKLFCDDGVVRSWEKYNGAALREAEAARNRAAEKRRLNRGGGYKKSTEPPTNGSPNRSPDGSGNGSPDGSLLRTNERNERDERTGQTPTASRAREPQPNRVAVARAVNRALLENFGENLEPLLPSSGGASRLCEAIDGLNIPIDFAESELYAAAKRCTERPRTLAYFAPGLIEKWERSRARIDASNGTAPAPTGPKMSAREANTAAAIARAAERWDRETEVPLAH